MNKNNINDISIGLELETNVVDLSSGKAVLDFNNSEEFSHLAAYLKKRKFRPLQMEHDAATVEFSTDAFATMDSAFIQLENNLTCAKEFLAKLNYGLLYAGIHPVRSVHDLIMSKNSRCARLLPLISGNVYNPVIHCGYQINFGVSAMMSEQLLPLLQMLQLTCWPCSSITQSSPIFSGTATNYKCFRVCINDALSSSRSGSLPAELSSIKQFEHYCAHMPDEEKTLRQNNVWFDFLPKKGIGGYRTEIRIADTTELKKLYIFTQAITLTWLSLKKLLNEHKKIITPYNHWFRLTRDHILKNGNQARLSYNGSDFYSLNEYLNAVWRPLVEQAAYEMNYDLDYIILQLSDDSRADMMLEAYKTCSAEDLVLSLIKKDHGIPRI